MNKKKIVSFIVSLALMICGAAMAIWPDAALNIMSKGLSFLAIAFGVILLLMYLFDAGRRAVSQWKLMTGVVMVMAGMFLLPKLSIVLSVIPFILGVFIICSGIAKLLHSLDYKKRGYKSWWISALIAVAAIILGGAAVIYPFRTVQFAIRIIGVLLIFDNFANVFDTVYIGYKLTRDGYVVMGDSDDSVIDVIQK